MMPKISVAMAVHNQAEYLPLAIQSILNQSFTDFEFLILDDGSTENIEKIINKFNDKRIKFIKNPKCLGLAKSLNFLIGQAKGEYIARMDADDISHPQRFTEQLKVFQNKDIALAGSWAKIIDKQGKPMGFFKNISNYIDIRKNILAGNTFNHPTVMFKKKIFEEFGGYDENLKYAQDYALFLKFVVKYKCINIPKPLISYRWPDDQSKEKKQLLIFLKQAIIAINHYGYKKWEIIKLLKPLIFYLMPSKLVKIYWKIKLNL